MNNIVESFVKWMEDQEIGTFDQDIFISRWPTGVEIPNSAYLVKAEGGDIQQRLVTGQLRQSFVISVRHRSVDPKNVYDALFGLQDKLLCEGCFNLEWYNISEPVNISGPFVDQDIDLEERTIGEILITLTIYKDSPCL